MRVDAVLHSKDIRLISAHAAAAEGCGHHGVWVTEEGTDPFLHAYAAAKATSTCLTGTAVAVAFARSPMTVALTAWQLADTADGRFVLGLGSQVRAHIERRYSMPWHNPIDQMRDYVAALRAIWHSWRTGDRLDYHGRYYEHSLTAPFWTPHPHHHPIPVYLAAVGPRMLELAGEVGDGVMLHPFSNRAYDDAVVRPQLELGLATGGRTLSQLDVSRSLFMVMADNDEQLEERRREASEKIAFYASTRSYAAVLEAVGFGDLQPELARLAKAKRWTEMATLVDGEVLEYFAVVGTPEQMPSMVREHLSPYVTRVSSYLGWPVDDSDRLRAILAEFDRPAPVA